METVKNTYRRQFIIFKLGKEEYGIDITKVTTIEQMKTIARVPKAPAYVKGVINLRGEIIPIVDLRLKLNMQEVEPTEDTRIIIIRIGDISVGIIVDAVMEVLELSEKDIEYLASFSSDVSLDYIFGVGKVENRIVTLINIDILIKLP